MATPGTEQLPREDEAQNLPITTDLDEEKTPTLDVVPDGGLRAWLVAAGAGCIFFASLGFSNSFGVFQEYYMTHQLRDRSPSDISWIGGLAAFLQLAVGSIGGPLFDRYGIWVIRPGGVLFVFAIMMTSLCKEYWQFVLAQGVLVGISTGLVMFPTMAIISQYFDKKRAAALGLAVSGSSIGGIVFPLAISKMLNKSSLGFGWTVRVIGFIMLPLLSFSIAVLKARLPPRKSNFFKGSAFKDVGFILLSFSLFFMFFGMFTPLFYIPAYAVTRGMDAALASYMLAILNASSTFGRIIPGILADKFGRLNVLGLGGITTGIIVLCMTKTESTAGIVVYSIAVGFCSGTIISGGSAALSVIPKDPRDIGTYVGMGLAVASVAALIGPPVNGVLLEKYGGYLEVSIFTGVLCLFGGCLALLSKATTPQGLLGRR